MMAPQPDRVKTGFGIPTPQAIMRTNAPPAGARVDQGSQPRWGNRGNQDRIDQRPTPTMPQPGEGAPPPAQQQPNQGQGNGQGNGQQGQGRDDPDGSLYGNKIEDIRQRITDRIFGGKNFPMTPEFRATLAALDSELEKQLTGFGAQQREIEAWIAQAKANIVKDYEAQTANLTQGANQAGLFGSGLMAQDNTSLNEAAFMDKADAQQQYLRQMGAVTDARGDAWSNWRQQLVAALWDRAHQVSSDPDLYAAGVNGRRSRRG
jgi:hypothetical protein